MKWMLREFHKVVTWHLIQHHITPGNMIAKSISSSSYSISLHSQQYFKLYVGWIEITAYIYLDKIVASTCVPALLNPCEGKMTFVCLKLRNDWTDCLKKQFVKLTLFYIQLKWWSMVSHVIPSQLPMIWSADDGPQISCYKEIEYVNLLVLKPESFKRTRSIAWLPLFWLPLTGYQQPWYRLCWINLSLSSTRKSFSCLCILSVEKWDTWTHWNV